MTLERDRAIIRATIIQGDARALPLPDRSVDLVVTSPPYYGLRSYTDGGQHYDGQLGDEDTVEAYIDGLIDATREMVRVLKPSGSIWVNLGDKYGRGSRTTVSGSSKSGFASPEHVPPTGFDKSLLGLPWRYALACTDDIGLILRAEVIWSKPNGLPESVQDRVRRSHEQWFHLTVQPRYYSAVDEIREPMLDESQHAATRRSRTDARLTLAGAGQTSAANPLGKLPGSVWEIPTQPLKVPEHLGVDHFAAFPMEWPRRLIRGWSPAGVCTECGEGLRPVTERKSGGRERSTTSAKDPSWQAINRADWQENVRYGITGYACACPEPTAATTPAVILDPFGGTGTTALVASALGRHGISVDRSADYCRIARWRTTDPGEHARALQAPKPPPQIDGQQVLL